MNDFQQNKALVLNFQAELDNASGNGIPDVLRTGIRISSEFGPVWKVRQTQSTQRLYDH